MIRSLRLMTALAALGCAAPPEVAVTGSLEARFGEAAEAVLDQAVRIEASERSITLRAEAHEEQLVFTGSAERGVTLRLRGGTSLQVIEDDAGGVVRSERGALRHARVGGASYWTLAEGGLEEWLALDEAYGDRPVATWRVVGHTLREIPERGVHVLRDGAPVAFVSAPRAVNDRGERVPTWLRVEGDRLALYVDGGGAAVLADPLWVATGSLALARSDTAVELVPGGAVILGGYVLTSGLATSASVERYDTLTGVWSSAGTLLHGRGIHRTVRLPSGEILLAGGDGAAGSTVASAEIYDPVTETSRAAGAMAAARLQHSMTLLPSGQVLVAGGSHGGILASAEIYDPSTNTWTPTGSMTVPRTVHSATLLPSGRVLVIGGTTIPSSASASAELYDPATGTWSATGSLSTTRHGHSATLLPSGLVLVAGGRGGPYLASAELYDPSTGTFTPTGSMSHARNYHTATLLPSGRVLIAGGADGPSIETVEIYDPASGTFRDAPSLSTTRIAHGAPLLASGRVLVAGGEDTTGRVTLTELFDESPICGNGELESGEDCDDGNDVDGDCCDALCAFEASSTVCRAAVSPCDIAERCSGTSGSCPMDVIADSVTTCRAANCVDGEASPETHCTGFSTVCPPPALVSCAPFACADLVCGECDTDADCGGLVCEGHLCVDPGDAGTDAGESADAGSDAGSLDAGSDGGTSASDAGSDGGASDAGASDAGARADAGDVPVSGGCSCAVPRSPASRSYSGALLLAWLVGVAARRIRSGRRRAAPRPS